jgi:hypothetical protein
MYEGEKLPKEQVAIIHGSSKFYGFAKVMTDIMEVVGIRCNLANSVEVLPGRHEIGALVCVKLASPECERKLGGYYPLVLYAMPGHEYQVKSSLWRTENTIVAVVDTRSSEIVASQPRKRRSYLYWYKPNVVVEQLRKDYRECKAKGLEKWCMQEKGYIWKASYLESRSCLSFKNIIPKKPD